MRNHTSVEEFILLGFPGTPMLQTALFVVFLMIFLITLMGNLIIIVVICLDYRLHTSMYFFLCNLSFLEALFITLILPGILRNLISSCKTISYASCLSQCYVYFYLGTVDFFLLSVMSIDRYLAICHPLHYPTIMNHSVSALMVLGCWVAAFLCLLLPIILLSRLSFSGPNKIDHFFCDTSAILELACSDTSFLRLICILVGSFVILGSLLLTGATYFCIFFTIFRMSSLQRQSKALSTCASHLTIVLLVYGSSLFTNIGTVSGHLLGIGKTVTVLSAIVVPLLNPFVYTLRNEDVKRALRDSIHRRRIRLGN
ncbi:olfactory receptor 6T1-like [Microcaecilia unicolor]|uniref:Olfactory receptor n=1 Tax=Microcaecilia unicolor TaxID=1415580 RepID=A0A6P7WQE2_9AMPH|nr:olfactory receptor 6T1-like [Microcaecilia unicolor]XP_030042599.1 olfactory receptor 6T1-like [Microcaecilia unicolor]